MRFHRPFSAALIAAAVTLAARSAAAQGIAVSFDESAAALPQDDIRTAVARELLHQPADGVAVSGALDVSVESEHIIVRFRSAQGYTERVLPLPEEREQIPVMLGLLAGNLARDQRAAVRPEPAAPAIALEPTVTPARERPAPQPQKPRPPYPRHFLGLHIAQDLMVVSGKNACDPSVGQVSENFACFYAGTEEPFVNAVEPSSDTVNSTLSIATTRVLLSYDFAVIPRLTLGLRAGYAFGGGPPAGKSPTPDGSGASTAGTAFMPWHVELRGSYWLTSLTQRQAWHAFVGVGLGLAQVDAKARHAVVDCEVFAGGHDTGEQLLSYEECRQGLHPEAAATTELDAWKKTGQGFAAAHVGAMMNVSESVAAMLDLSIMMMFPAYGVSFEPSVGMVVTP